MTRRYTSAEAASTRAEGVEAATLGGCPEGLWRRSIVVMNSQIHTLLVAHHVESRIQDAAGERLARDLHRQRQDARRSVRRRRRRYFHVTARA